MIAKTSDRSIMTILYLEADPGRPQEDAAQGSVNATRDY